MSLTVVDIKTVDLRCRPYSTGLFTRLIWQELFNWYVKSEGDLKNMDNLLVDYDQLKIFVENGYSLHQKDQRKIWWNISLRTGFSNLYGYFPHETCAEISLEDQFITITFYEER
jgi:hypothetical protein